MRSEMPDTKQHILYDSIYIKIENWQTFSMVLEIMRVVTTGESIMYERLQ